MQPKGLTRMVLPYDPSRRTMTRRILHVIPSLRPGGAERQLGYLCQGLVPLGWDVHVATFEGGGPVQERIEASGATLHVLARGHTYDPRVVGEVALLMRRLQPTFAQTWLTTADVVGGAAALATRTPWILSDRCLVVEDMAPPKFKVLVRMAPYARAIIANSEVGADFWGARLVAAPPRFVVRNALPRGELAASPRADRAAYGIPADVPLILTAGRLHSKKNIITLLAALERVMRETPAMALVGGEGPLAGEVRRFIDSRGLGARIIAAGFLSNVWSWMKTADVFVSASRYEGMPNAVMEAMAAGCPIVLSDMVSHREVVPADGALFAPVEDPIALADALCDALTHREAALARAAVSSTAADAWSVDAVARRYAELYEQLR